jgi:hypothetical protein
LVQAVKRAGAHKILFGSDGPFLHPGVELHKIKMLKLPPSQQALITGGNISRLLTGTNRLPDYQKIESPELAGDPIQTPSNA